MVNLSSTATAPFFDGQLHRVGGELDPVRDPDVGTAVTCAEPQMAAVAAVAMATPTAVKRSRAVPARFIPVSL